MAVSGLHSLDGSQRTKLWGESVSSTSTAGSISSNRAVPAGKVWILMAVRAVNGEASARKVELFVDDGSTPRAALANGNGLVDADANNGVVGWTGRLVMTAGWRVVARFLGMAGGSTCSFQYTALEVDADSPILKHDITAAA